MFGFEKHKLRFYAKKIPELVWENFFGTLCRDFSNQFKLSQLSQGQGLTGDILQYHMYRWKLEISLDLNYISCLVF